MEKRRRAETDGVGFSRKTTLVERENTYKSSRFCPYTIFEKKTHFALEHKNFWPIEHDTFPRPHFCLLRIFFDETRDESPRNRWWGLLTRTKCLPHRWSCWVIPSILCPPLIPYFTTLILGVDDALCPRWCASLIKEDPGFLLFLPREGSFYASRSKSFFSKKKGKGTQHTALPLPSRCRLRDSCSSLQLVCLAATRYSEAEKRTLSSVTLDPFLNKYVKTKHSDYTLSHGRGRAFLVQHF